VSWDGSRLKSARSVARVEESTDHHGTILAEYRTREEATAGDAAIVA
jgi:hypothetical protein